MACGSGAPFRWCRVSLTPSEWCPTADLNVRKRRTAEAVRRPTSAVHFVHDALRSPCRLPVLLGIRVYDPRADQNDDLRLLAFGSRLHALGRECLSVSTRQLGLQRGSRELC